MEGAPVRLRTIAPIVLVAVLVTACAEGPEAGGDATSSVAHGTSPSDLLLRWGYEGGFTPPEFQLTNLPSFSLYGDGTIVRPGPQIEIYPGPALPALETVRVDEAGIEAILDAARDAGLDTVTDLTDMGTVGVADAADTVFTLQDGRVARTVRVYALGDFGGQLPGMPDEEFEARKKLLELVEDLGSLETWLPRGSLGDSTVYEASGARVFVSKYGGQPDLPQEAVAWPLETPLQGIGDDAGTGFRCVVVTGAQWTDELLPVAQTANQATPWTSDGRRYALAFRPLLPDETGC
jgi:hypothetical protein